MSYNKGKQVQFLVVDTTAFIQNASLHDVAEYIITCQEVVDEVTNKRQLRRLVALPYNLIVKDVFQEHVKLITKFSKKTGDYPSLSPTDIKVMALTYQLEKEKSGIEHLKKEPTLQRALVTTNNISKEVNPDITGFFLPKTKENIKDTDSNVKDNFESNTNENNIIYIETKNNEIQKQDIDYNIKDLKSNNVINCTGDTKSDKKNICNSIETSLSQLENVSSQADNVSKDGVLIPVNKWRDSSDNSLSDSSSVEYEDDDESGWINPSNVSIAKKQVNSQLIEEKQVTVACMTTDFAMQNVLKQINLNVCALDGRIIKQLRTYILRCYACFKTTSLMTKKFCPKCGNNTLKKVAVSVNEDGKMQIHINPRRPLTGRGKKFSLPRIKGGKHPNNPVIVEDQPMPDNKPSRLARTKNNPLDDDYIAGYSPFVTRDVNSKSAQLHIRPGSEFKQWMKRNPNESRKKRK